MSTVHLKISDYDARCLGLLINPSDDATTTMSNNMRPFSFIMHHLDPSKSRVEHSLWRLLSIDEARNTKWKITKEHISINVFRLICETIVFPSFSRKEPIPVDHVSNVKPSDPCESIHVASYTGIKLTMSVDICIKPSGEVEIHPANIDLDHSTKVDDGRIIGLLPTSDESTSENLFIIYKHLEVVAPTFRAKLDRFIQDYSISTLYT